MGFHRLTASTRETTAGLAAAPPGLLPPASPRVGGRRRRLGDRWLLRPRHGPAEAGWRPLTDLFTTPDALAARIADVAETAGTTETRVAASILFQGLAARLWSPVLGAAVVHDLLIDLTPAEVFWRPAAQRPPPATGRPADRPAVPTPPGSPRRCTAPSSPNCWNRWPGPSRPS